MNSDQIKHIIDNWNNLKWSLRKRNKFIKSLSSMNFNILDFELQEKIKSFLSQVTSKGNNKIIKKILIFIFIILILVGNYLIYIEIRPKFKDIKVELGTNNVSVSSFLVSSMYKDSAKILTDLSKINFSSVSETDVKLSYKGKEETVKLKILDTTSPVVEFQNISRLSGYKVNAEDFIVDKQDASEMNITATQIEDTMDYKDYVVEVIVSDKYGNKTSKNCILTITWLNPIVHIELGSTFSKDMIMENANKFGDNVSQSEMDKVNVMVLGEYVINVTYNNKNYTSKIIVQDTTPPELELKNLTIYDNDKVTKDSFIKSVKDASDVIETIMKTEIDYTKSGGQQVKIEASDVSGNKIEKTATLTIIKDITGPVFSGIKDLYTSKYSTINYNSGITANDANDGSCKFSVDTSKVNTSVAGTYYATYTSKDSKGNITTAKRKIVINHDQADTDKKFNEFYDKYLAGKSIVDMATTIRTIIKYNTNWGGDDPVWYGLTNNTGNCYVHALILQKALNKAGITNKLINVTDKTHYWNLVYMNGVWRHIDSCPGTHILGPATDDEKYNSAAMKGRNWDRSAYPQAN